MLVVVLLGAVQMFVLGMIGEYLGRLYVESKRRPLYLVADIAGPVQGMATLGYRAEDRASRPASRRSRSKRSVSQVGADSSRLSASTARHDTGTGIALSASAPPA